MTKENIEVHVNRLATDQGRMVGTVGHEDAREYILDYLLKTSAIPCSGTTYDLPYSSNGEAFVNISGVIKGRKSALDPILVGAHYDSVYGTPGADDNAAAVAILLEVARTLSAGDLERDLIINFFDAEEPPYFQNQSMGSVRYYEDQQVRDIHCALIMDLVGHDVPIPGYEDLLFVTGMESQLGLSHTIRNTQPPQGLRPLPILNSYTGDLSDHYIFRKNEVPYLFMSCGIWTHYHSPTDTPDRLNYDKTVLVSQYLINLVRDIDARALDGGYGGYDSTEIEAEFLNSTVGPLLPAGKVTTRQDIDQAVTAVALKFGL